MPDQDDDEEERIRAFAYRIWEEEGRPLGEADRHWEMARKAIEAEDAERRRIAVGIGNPGEGAEKPEPGA